MEETIFAKIIRKELPADIVYEDDETLAFLDIKPNNLGHTLVIPKEPARNIFDIGEESFVSVMKRVRKLAKAVKEVTGADGVNILMNNEPEAGQVVFHAHIHIIPRFADDGMETWRKTATYAEGEKSALAEKIKSSLT
jgi:histidine triad (HIT) family protein